MGCSRDQRAGQRTQRSRVLHPGGVRARTARRVGRRPCLDHPRPGRGERGVVPRRRAGPGRPRDGVEGRTTAHLSIRRLAPARDCGPAGRRDADHRRGRALAGGVDQRPSGRDLGGDRRGGRPHRRERRARRCVPDRDERSGGGGRGDRRVAGSDRPGPGRAVRAARARLAPALAGGGLPHRRRCAGRSCAVVRRLPPPRPGPRRRRGRDRGPRPDRSGLRRSRLLGHGRVRPAIPRGGGARRRPGGPALPLGARRTGALPPPRPTGWPERGSLGSRRAAVSR